jgi:hypothetical protein
MMVANPLAAMGGADDADDAEHESAAACDASVPLQELELCKVTVQGSVGGLALLPGPCSLPEGKHTSGMPHVRCSSSLRGVVRGNRCGCDQG